MFEESSLLKVSESVYITEDAFVERFGDEYNYDKLIKHENTDDKWKERFRLMKEQGILS